jgi:hypothetical protein
MSRDRRDPDTFDRLARAADAGAMTRHRFPTVIALAAIAVLLAACGATTPNKPELTDPKAIIGAAATQAAAAEGVHIDASLDGSLTLDLMGLGGGGAPVDLTGTTASVDLSIPTGDARATFAIASAIRGELRSVDGVAYLKTTLTGAQYQVQEGFPTIPPDAIPAALDALLQLLEEPGLEPVKEADVTCAGGTCYRVSLALTVADLADLGIDVPLAALPPEFADASLDLTIDVTRDTNDLSSIEAVLTQAGGDTLTLVATFTKWGEPVTVEAPAPDEIAPNDG